ncbi:VWA domain-containing protein [Reinekea marina]|uniref:von Willebrand factor type A domain-containing protein n=1 Tax=Reinekea marina TaxID=1310421 RepID=A0ABV7WQX0_9GAMM|nr:VWA domain-containing protein [Reinekea marina]MDN3648057.1 VWA domain-containing protein [Reinekea marina]
MKLSTPLSLLTIAIISACGARTSHNDITMAEPYKAPSELTEVKSTAPAATNHKAIKKVHSLVYESDSVADSVTTLVEPALHGRSIIDNDMGLPVQNNEKYANAKLSPIKIVADDPVSTFSTDVDTASYTNARRFLEHGSLPPTDAIRVEEFINYFDYGLKAPTSLQEPIAIETELTTTPWNEHTQLMRVSLQAYKSNMADLPPLNLVFLLDVSGSMGDPDKLPLMQRSFNLLVDQLRPQDRVSIAVYAGDSGVALEPTAGDQKQTIINAINQLRSGGSTHGSAGIHLAYELAQANFDKDSINRVIIGTDGDFNVGTVGIDSLKDLIESKRESGVFLNVLGFGTGNYNDHLMEELSNHGNGVAYYIDSYQEARKIFSEQLTATLQTVAKDVKIQVEFNPANVAEYRLIGYDNRQLQREDFNNDKIDAGEMGSGHTVTALYEVVPAHSEFRFNDPLRYNTTETAKSLPDSNELAFVKVRYKLPSNSHSELMNIPVERTVTQSSTTMTFVTGVAGFAEQLRHSPYVQNFTYADTEALVKTGLENDRWGYRQQLLQLVKNAQSVQGNQ